MQVNKPLSATFEALMKFLLPMSRPWGATGTVPEGFVYHCIVICFEQSTAKKGGKQMRTKDHHCKYDQVNINCTNNLFATKKMWRSQSTNLGRYKVGPLLVLNGVINLRRISRGPPCRFLKTHRNPDVLDPLKLGSSWIGKKNICFGVNPFPICGWSSHL